MASDLAAKAKEAFIDDHFELAVDLYSQAISFEPNNPEFYSDRAQANIKLHNFTEAVADANKAIELDSSNPKAYLRKGLACFSLEEYQTAKTAFEAGSALAPEDSRFADWMNKCDKCIAEENGELPTQSPDATLTNGVALNAQQPENVDATTKDAEQVKNSEMIITPAKPKYRHEYYQKPDEVVVTIFAKGIPGNSVSINYGEQIFFVVRMLMLSCYYATPNLIGRLPFIEFPKKASNFVVCAAKGPRPRYPRVWKTRPKIGTVSKSLKLVECIKGLSNVKEEVYGALDSFIAWDLEFPLITVKKALKALEYEKEWKRIIQVTKWMLSKGQGRTMGSYYLLLYALAEDGRIDEAEELWSKLFSDNLESMPRMFFDRMITIYYQRQMHDKMFEVFADMEELGIRPTVSVVNMVGDVFQKLGMLDKYQKLKKKYPLPKWEYRYIKGKRVKIRSQNLKQPENANKEVKEVSNEANDEDSSSDQYEVDENELL